MNSLHQVNRAVGKIPSHKISVCTLVVRRHVLVHTTKSMNSFVGDDRQCAQRVGQLAAVKIGVIRCQGKRTRPLLQMNEAARDEISLCL